MSTTPRRSWFAVPVVALVLVVGVFASGSEARKHRARSGTSVATTSVAKSTPATSVPTTSLPTTSLPTTSLPTTRVATPGVTPITLHPKAKPESPTQPSNRADPRLRSIGFRSQTRLDDHYAKHGIEFGSITKAQYLAMAQDLRDAALSPTVLQASQTDGSLSRFDRRTGAFLAYNSDLTIRTFFRPNDGEAYFRRAAAKSR